MFFQQFSATLLIIIFIVSTIAIWIAGVKITKAIDTITTYYNLSEAFGGMFFLAIVTNLPEIAITCVAAYHHNYDIAVSNLLGGIAIQTFVLVLIDAFGVGYKAPLTYRGKGPILIIEGVSLIFILTIVMMSKQFSNDVFFFRSTPFEWLILFIWLGSIHFISRLSKKNKTTSDVIQSENKIEHLAEKKLKRSAHHQTAIIIFIICAIITLIAGWALEESSDLLAKHFNMSGILFGATFLALATALPEISTGIASAKIKDYQMAVSDIFGGNAFLPVLFLVASLIGGDAILPSLKPSDMYLTGLGIILTGIYIIGMVVGSKKQFFNLGVDSIIVTVVYIAGVIGLVFLV